MQADYGFTQFAVPLVNPQVSKPEFLNVAQNVWLIRLSGAEPW